MHRVVGLLPGGQVAARVPAIGRLNRQIVIPVDVTQASLHVGVSLCQQKARGAMVELPRRPRGDRMATRASRGRRREARRDVVRDIPA